MGGPIIRSYGVPNFDLIFGKKSSDSKPAKGTSGNGSSPKKGAKKTPKKSSPKSQAAVAPPKKSATKKAGKKGKKK